MNLREWISNSEMMNEIIERKDRTECKTVNVLGHFWDVENDSLSLKPTDVLHGLHTPTKRNVLKEMSSVFDQLGLFSPILLKGKCFLQTLWKKNLNWDDNLDGEDMKVWPSIRSDLKTTSLNIQPIAALVFVLPTKM